jgi:hypothetical protein
VCQPRLGVADRVGTWRKVWRRARPCILDVDVRGLRAAFPCPAPALLLHDMPSLHVCASAPSLGMDGLAIISRFTPRGSTLNDARTRLCGSRARARQHTSHLCSRRVLPPPCRRRVRVYVRHPHPPCLSSADAVLLCTEKTCSRRRSELELPWHVSSLHDLCLSRSYLCLVCVP